MVCVLSTDGSLLLYHCINRLPGANLNVISAPQPIDLSQVKLQPPANQYQPLAASANQASDSANPPPAYKPPANQPTPSAANQPAPGSANQPPPFAAAANRAPPSAFTSLVQASQVCVSWLFTCLLRLNYFFFDKLRCDSVLQPDAQPTKDDEEQKRVGFFIPSIVGSTYMCAVYFSSKFYRCIVNDASLYIFKRSEKIVLT